ncbi:MAG: hypothetical protein AAB354_06510 [candidate division KSB1 bacterium]
MLLVSVPQSRSVLHSYNSIAHRRLEIDPALPLVEILDKLELRQEDRLTYAATLLFAKEPQRFCVAVRSALRPLQRN